MSYRFIVILLVLCLCVPGVARAVPVRKQPSPNTHLLRDCVASFFFGGTATTDGRIPTHLDRKQRAEWQTWRASAVRAERAFRRMSGAELRRALAPMLGQTRPGSTSNVSVAYVLAIHDVDRHANIDRMLRVYDLTGPITSTALDTTVRNWYWGSVPDHLPDNLARIYRKSRDPFVLRRLFAIKADGVFAEAQDDAMSRLLYEFTSDVLRVVAERPDTLRKMSGAVQDGIIGPPRGLKNRLQAIAGGRDKKMAETALVLLKAMMKYPGD